MKALTGKEKQMETISKPFPRRSFVAALGGGLLATVVPLRLSQAAVPRSEMGLTVKPGRVALVSSPYPETDVWSYNDDVPGPEIRLRQGERLRVVVQNHLAEGTTIHWHGVRVPNAMDGVPGLTQKPIKPGESFVYEFGVPDAGTYWYHPHDHSSEQVGRGLAGALIIEEREPPTVDRDVTWVLGDWRLKRDASIAGDFNNPMEMAMAGRIGNTVTVNGRLRDTFSVRAGERLRLRLINAAAARIFALTFKGHRPLIVALDGQPIEPHAPDGGRVILGPAMRADVILDMTGKPGERFSVADTFYRNLGYTLLHLAYSNEKALRNQALAPPKLLPANTMPEPDLDRATRHEVRLQGGMMGGGGMGGMMSGMAWSINGVSASGHDMSPMLTLKRGSTYILAIKNETAWHHPIHLHGHSFRVIARNGKPTRYREWQDTVLIPPRETADIAFVADNPGNWMLHCHILDHQEGGLMAVVRVA